MKPLFLAVAAIAFGFSSKAQCEKVLQLSSSKTDYLNGSNAIQKSKDENTVVDITKTTITIVPNGNASDALSGKIEEISCDWPVPFKQGKTVIKTVLYDASGDDKNATITIEAKDGKVFLLAEAKERPDQKIRLVVTKFEEKR